MHACMEHIMCMGAVVDCMHIATSAVLGAHLCMCAGVAAVMAMEPCPGMEGMTLSQGALQRRRGSRGLIGSSQHACACAGLSRRLRTPTASSQQPESIAALALIALGVIK